MSFTLLDCWDCGPTAADYVGLAIAAAMFALPLFFWLHERSKREIEDKRDLGFFDSKQSLQWLDRRPGKREKKFPLDLLTESFS